MKRIIGVIVLLVAITNIVYAETPPEEAWSKTFGGTDGDWANSVQQTSDGGYISVGYTWSYGAGDADFWLVKTDSNGYEQWNKTFGGQGADYANSVQQTSDGGYIIAGMTTSYGAYTPYGARHGDFWLVKTDSNGDEQWNKTFGGINCDEAHSVQQTSDGGYILAGKTQSYGAGDYDFWLVKTDSNGDEQWNKTFGGQGADYANSVQQTSDGGYIITGFTRSHDAGSADFRLVKTDFNGNKQWERTFGGRGGDYAYSVQQSTDGGYILAGSTNSYGAGSYDFWLVKTDSDGNKQWDRTFGGTDWDEANSVQQTSDGGYIIAGETRSYGAGPKDGWLVKTDANGKKQWDWVFGGTEQDYVHSVQQTSDGDYILAGFTDSYGAGSADFWLVKTEMPIGQVTPIAIISIRVQSTPSAADIYLDGVYQGITGSDWFWIHDVSIGLHTITLEKEGYEDYTETIHVSEGHLTSVSVSLSEIHTIPAEVPDPEMQTKLLPILPFLAAAVFIALVLIVASHKKKALASPPPEPTSSPFEDVPITAPKTSSEIKNKRSAVVLVCIIVSIALFFAIDFDGDKLPTITELCIRTSINNPDTDGDGLFDGLEVRTYKTDPLSVDSDGDGFSDYDEVRIHKTDPNTRTVSIISVTTTPISGTIFINGQFGGTGTASKECSPGTYTITFGSVADYHSPDPQRVTLEPGNNLNVVGTYTAFLPAQLEINEVSQTVSGISPSIYKFLFNNGEPLLQLTVTNTGEIKAEQVSLSSKLSGMVDWQAKTVQNIEPKSTISIDVTPTMPEVALTGYSKSRSEAIMFKLEYQSNGVEHTPTKTSHDITIHGKNALPLSDASKLASKYSIPSDRYFYAYYITPQDGSIRKFATSATTGKNTADDKAQAIFDELGRSGVRYASDPNDPLGSGIEYVQFPSETLELKRGDCDDLAVLYASLLESVKVNTKLVHIPHHVFVGYEYASGKWHLVETTMIRAPITIADIPPEYHSYFGEACDKGYENWADNKRSAVTIGTRDAWELGIRH